MLKWYEIIYFEKGDAENVINIFMTDKWNSLMWTLLELTSFLQILITSIKQLLLYIQTINANQG